MPRLISNDLQYLASTTYRILRNYYCHSIAPKCKSGQIFSSNLYKETWLNCICKQFLNANDYITMTLISLQTKSVPFGGYISLGCIHIKKLGNIFQFSATHALKITAWQMFYEMGRNRVETIFLFIFRDCLSTEEWYAFPVNNKTRLCPQMPQKICVYNHVLSKMKNVTRTYIFN